MTTIQRKKNDNGTLTRRRVVGALQLAAMALLFGGFLVMFAQVPNGTLGRVALTPDGCTSVRLAGGNPQVEDGVCMASGRYTRSLSGWVSLALKPGIVVDLSPQSVVLMADDDRLSAPEDVGRRLWFFVFGGVVMVAGAVLLWLGIRLGRRAQQDAP